MRFGQKNKGDWKGKQENLWKVLMERKEKGAGENYKMKETEEGVG
jgi:hypothetical protein